MSRATWIGLGMGVALLVALAWLLGWGADPAPPVPQLGGAPLSDLYPEWVRSGGGALPWPTVRNGVGGPIFAQAEHVPWMLWRARQSGSPLHQMMRRIGPRMPAAIQSRLPTALDPEYVRTQIATDLEMAIANRGLRHSDILREMIRVAPASQRGLTEILRQMGQTTILFRPQTGDETPKLFLQLAREADPAIRVVAGVQLLEWYPSPFRGVDDALQPLLLQLAKDRAGEPVDWSRLARHSVELPSPSFGYDPILKELEDHPDPTVALLARGALILRTQPSELAPLIRAEFSVPDLFRQRLLVSLLALGSPKQLSQLQPDVASSIVEALDAARSANRDAAMSLAAAVARLSHRLFIPVDERILRAVQDPFLTEPILDVIGAGGRTNANAFAAVAPFLRSDVLGIRRTAFDAAIRIHEPDAELWVHVRESLQDPVRQDLALAVVPRFGAQAHEVLPRLREIASDPSQARGMAEMRRLAGEAIRAVEAGWAGP